MEKLKIEENLINWHGKMFPLLFIRSVGSISAIVNRIQENKEVIVYEYDIDFVVKGGLHRRLSTEQEAIDERDMVILHWKEYLSKCGMSEYVILGSVG